MRALSVSSALRSPPGVVRAVFVLGAAAGLVGLRRSRERVALDARRLQMLKAVAQIADASETVQETVGLLGELLVPQLADICVIDVVRDGRIDRLAVAVAGPAAATIEAALRRRASVAGPAEGAMRSNEPVLHERWSDASLRSVALGDEDLAFLRSLELRSSISVPLRARRHAIGSMTLIVTSHSGRRYDREDLEFGEILSGRVALALDNAGLFSELEALEAQQTAALGSLAEAVTMQNARGELVYANEAAARAFGFRSAQELLATPLEQLNDAYESYNEDGSPLRSEQLPSRQVLAGEPASPLTIRAIHRATGEERWRIIKTTAVADDGGVPRLAVNVIEDVTEVKRAELAQRFLARAGELLSSSLDYEETLAQVTRLAVPELADWCGVSLPDDHGYLRSVAVAHVDPTMVRFAQDYNQRYPTKTSDPAGAAQVVRDGESQVVNEITDELLEQAIADREQLDAIRTLGMRAVMIVPIVAAGGVVGTINFVSAESGRTFTPADVALAEEIGRRAGTAIENARLYTERSYVAHTLQASLLPDELPRIPRFEVASLYRPAGEASFVGGDFYDAFETAAGWMLVVGDVTGRGVEAAALTAQARHTVRAVGALLADPVAAIDRLNRTLAAKPQLSICTVAIVLLTETEAATTATVVCAGHPRPLLVRDGAVRPVGSGGPMVGAWQDSVWESERFELEPNDLLVLYTDGVTDARAGAERFSDERLIAAVRDAADADDAVARVLAAVEAFERGPQADDTALVVARRLARPPRRASAASAARSRQRRGPARSPPR